jgi:hypothetical protein
MLLRLALCLGLALTFGCNENNGRVAPLLEASSRLLVENFAHARLLAPGDRTTLAVRLIGPDAAPLAGRTIVFQAPDRGPSGSFGALAGTATLEAISITDTDGFADTARTVTFAITVTGLPAPALDASAARQFFTETLSGGDFGERALLHGPFLVPAGSEISTDLGDTGDGTVFTAANESWIAWLDHEPGADFEHPTRFFAVDASLAAPQAGEAFVHDDERWFELREPGEAEARPLREPSRTNAPTGVDEIGNAALAGNTRDECVIVAYGPSEPTKPRTAHAIATFFRKLRQSRHVQEQTGEPSTLKSLKEMFATAREQNCPKLFLYMIGHGYRLGEPSIMLGADDDPNQKTRVNHRAIATELKEAFEGTGTQVCVVIATCFAARGIVEYQNLGLDGEAFATSDDNRFSYNRASSFNYFASSLIECWEKDPGQSLAEAVACVRAGISVSETQAVLWLAAEEAEQEHGINSDNRCDVYLAQADPVSHPLRATAKDWNPALPNLTLRISERGTITIPRPTDESQLPARGDMRLTVGLADFVIAQLVGVPPGQNLVTTMGIAADSQTVEVVGLTPGMATYTVTSRGHRDVYRGTGKITVLAPSVVLDYDHGPFPAGTEIALTRISGGRLVMGEDGCQNGAPHLHGDITIDGEGPYGDQGPNGCGHGVVANYPQ